MAEFAAAVGLPTETGKAYLGEALELRHRLPRTWARVGSGDLAAWRARRIARATIALSPAAAGFVDDQVAGFAHRIRPSGVDRLVEEAIVRFMPEEARRRREAAADGRHAHVHTASGVLRGHRVGARPRSTWPTPWTSTPPSRSAPPGSPTSARPRRWTCAAPKPSGRWPATSCRWTSTPPPDRARTGSGPRGGAARPPLRGRDHGTRRRSCIWPGWRTPARFVDADQVRTWCGRPGTTVTVRPVVDLTEHLHVNQYEVPDRLAAQAAERDLTCVFPWCTRPAEACDLDHVIPYAEGGTTAATTSRPCAVATTGSRPTTPAGATPCWNPAPTCGPHRTATSSCATTAAPPTSPATRHRTHPTE